MTLRLEIKKLMLERSPRVKAIDFHPQNPWVVFALYSGTLALHDYSNNTCIRTLQASTFPIRTIKFIPQKNWIVCGSDDFQLRIFNYNTMEKVKTVEAHADFIRSIIVHPTEPYVITSSDDAKIKIWNYEKDFSLVRTLDEHKHFVMALAFNPKDLTKFGSTSMDKTIKIWNLTTEGKANFTLQGHKGSVNAIDFYKGDKPHLATGSDDHTIKIWDYQTRQCLHTLEVYKMAVTSVQYHPDLPLLISTAEDGFSLIHHSGNHTLLNTLEYNLGMGWSAAVSSENPNVIGLGFDEGSVLIKVGSDEPVVTMHNGKILYTKNMQVFNTNLKAVSYDDQQKISFDVQRVFASPKQLGSSDLYPTFINYSPNGHHFGICNTKQFAVIKIASFKNVILGNGSQLTWHSENDFVVVENDTIHQYVGFEYTSSMKIPFLPERIFEGQLLTVSGKDTTLLYDWSNLSKPLHKLEQQTQKVWWDQDGNTVVISTGDKFNVYQYNKKNYALTEILQVNDRVTSGCFIGSIFYYMNKGGKIFFSFLGKEFFFCNADKKQFILGGVEQQNRLYLFDRSNSIYSLYIPFQMINNVSKFVSGQLKAEPQIPEEFKNRIAKCYHSFNLLKEAYKLTSNHDHKFDLALALGYTRDAYKIAMTNNMNQKIKLIGDLSLKKGEIELAIECFEKIDDLGSLLMIYSSLQLGQKLKKVGERAERMTRMNIAYMCYFLTNNPSKCIDVLIKSKRFSEAALFARTYFSERISECVRLWKESLTDKTIAQKISDPTEDHEEEGEQEAGEQGEEEAEVEQ